MYQIILTLSTAYTSHTDSLVVYRPNTLECDCAWRTNRLRANDDRQVHEELG